MTPDNAFNLAVRVHRGGGFTKDYLYLNGVAQALRLYEKQDISHLYVGKTGFAYLPIITEMIGRQLVKPPSYLPVWLHKPKTSEPVLDYLMHCVRYDHLQNAVDSDKQFWQASA